MIIQHGFSNEPESLKLFSEIEKFSQFKKKLISLSSTLPQINPIRWGRKVSQKENENKILGEGFELFCELFVKHMGFHPHIGLSDYEPIQSDDEGVDAWAVNLKAEKSAVQCKFVNDATYEFTANGSNLTNFLIEANFSGIDFKDQQMKRLFLITTAKGLHYHTVEKWRDSVFVINLNTIKTLTDGNLIFWKSCFKILNEMRKE